MKILGIIPARGGSKGIPHKNIKPLNGLPLIAYTIRQALNSKLLTDILVSTDDNAIASVAKEYGALVPFIRPASLSTSKAKSVDVIIHAVEFLQENGRTYDAVCLLQATSPYRPGTSIDDAISSFCNGNSSSLVSIRKIPDHFNPHWAFEKGLNGILSIATRDQEIISRRQDLPPAFHRDGAIYLVKTDYLLKYKSLISKDLSGFEIDSPTLINIDTLSDWVEAEKYIYP